MKITIVILFLMMSFSFIEAAFEEKENSARVVGMGGAFTAISDDGCSISYNPAGLIQINSSQFNISYTNLFGLNELQYIIFNFTIPMKKIAIGLSFQDFGAEIYHEKISRLSLGWNLCPKISLGVIANRMDLNIQQYGQDSMTGVTIGLLWRLNEQIRTGVCIANINSERLEKGLRMGISWKVMPSLIWSTDIENSKRFGNEFKFGQEIWLSDTFCVRTGYQKSGAKLTGGFGIRANQLFRLDYACLTHPKLGISHFFSITKTFGER